MAGSNPKTEFSKTELRKLLTPLQYHVTQEKGTERAFTGKYYKMKDHGVYACVVCGEELFSSDTKYDSGSGWPAFSDIIEQGKVKLTQDMSHVGANLLLLINNPGLVRTEVSCARCGSHMGHVFKDGPKPSGKRFCVNSAALSFRKNEQNGTEENGAEENGELENGVFEMSVCAKMNSCGSYCNGRSDISGELKFNGEKKLNGTV